MIPDTYIDTWAGYVHQHYPSRSGWRAGDWDTLSAQLRHQYIRMVTQAHSIFERSLTLDPHDFSEDEYERNCFREIDWSAWGTFDDDDDTLRHLIGMLHDCFEKDQAAILQARLLVAPEGTQSLTSQLNRIR